MIRTTLVLLLLAGCARVEFPQQTPEDLSAQQLTPEDIAVYEALVVAYAANGQILGWPPPAPQNRRPLTLAEVEQRTRESQMRLYVETNVRSRLMEPPPDRWWTLDEKRLDHLDVPAEMFLDFQNRNRRPTSLKAWQPRHLHVKRTTEQMGDILTSAILSLTLPGYSAAGDMAVVEVSISTSPMSGGGELLFLRKEAGVWRVVARQQTWIS